MRKFSGFFWKHGKENSSGGVATHCDVELQDSGTFHSAQASAQGFSSHDVIPAQLETEIAEPVFS